MGEKDWRFRLLVSRFLLRLDHLHHRKVPLLGWACNAHEATNIAEYPELEDWPGGRLLTAFHRWFWAGS